MAKSGIICIIKEKGVHSVDKLQYDSLYKFLVSLGIVLIALPITALIFLANGTIHIISKTEYETLSEYSIRNLEQHEYIIALIIKFLPIISLIFVISGIVLIGFGLIKWHHIQKDLDSKLASETKMKELEYAQMSNAEILTKNMREVEEAPSINSTSTPLHTTPHFSQSERWLKYAEIEDKFFRYGIPLPIRRRHSYRRNLKIGGYEYDAIGISLKTDIDSIYEVKYWENIPPSALLQQTLERVHKAGANYKSIEGRNYHSILAIICPKEMLDNHTKRINTFLEKHPEFNYSDIEIKIISEESLVHPE